MSLGCRKDKCSQLLVETTTTNDECYYDEDSYVVYEQTGGFRPSAQGSNQENWHQGQMYGNYNREGHYVRDGNYNRKNNFNKGNYGNRNDRNGPYVPP